MRTPTWSLLLWGCLGLVGGGIVGGIGGFLYFCTRPEPVHPLDFQAFAIFQDVPVGITIGAAFGLGIALAVRATRKMNS